MEHNSGRRSPDEMSELFTIPEVAEFLKVSVSTVRKKIREGELSAIHVGRLVRVKKRALQAYLEGEEG